MNPNSCVTGSARIRVSVLTSLMVEENGELHTIDFAKAATI